MLEAYHVIVTRTAVIRLERHVFVSAGGKKPNRNNCVKKNTYTFSPLPQGLAHFPKRRRLASRRFGCGGKPSPQVPPVVPAGRQGHQAGQIISMMSVVVVVVVLLLLLFGHEGFCGTGCGHTLVPSSSCSCVYLCVVVTEILSLAQVLCTTAERGLDSGNGATLG